MLPWETVIYEQGPLCKNCEVHLRRLARYFDQESNGMQVLWNIMITEYDIREWLFAPCFLHFLRHSCKLHAQVKVQLHSQGVHGFCNVGVYVGMPCRMSPRSSCFSSCAYIYINTKRGISVLVDLTLLTYEEISSIWGSLFRVICARQVIQKMHVA